MSTCTPAWGQGEGLLLRGNPQAAQSWIGLGVVTTLEQMEQEATWLCPSVARAGQPLRVASYCAGLAVREWPRTSHVGGIPGLKDASGDPELPGVATRGRRLKSMSRSELRGMAPQRADLTSSPLGGQRRLPGGGEHLSRRMKGVGLSRKSSRK